MPCPSRSTPSRTGPPCRPCLVLRVCKRCSLTVSGAAATGMGAHAADLAQRPCGAGHCPVAAGLATRWCRFSRRRTPMPSGHCCCPLWPHRHASMRGGWCWWHRPICHLRQRCRRRACAAAAVLCAGAEPARAGAGLGLRASAALPRCAGRAGLAAAADAAGAARRWPPHRRDGPCGCGRTCRPGSTARLRPCACVWKERRRLAQQMA